MCSKSINVLAKTPVWMVHNKGCTRACQYINAYCNQQTCLGKNAFATSSHLWDWVFFPLTLVWLLRWADFVVREGTSKPGASVLLPVFPSVLSGSFCLLSSLCVLGREREHTSESYRFTEWAAHQRQLFCLDSWFLLTLPSFVYFGVE